MGDSLFNVGHEQNNNSHVEFVPEERATLDAWARGRNLPYRKVVRSRIITIAADGVLNQEIANALSVSRPTV